MPEEGDHDQYRAYWPREFLLLQEEIDRRFRSSQLQMDQRFVASQLLADQRAIAEEKLLNERHATQTKATDKAFDAQQLAMKTAFDAADKAVQAALQAAKEATVKAEMAADKRFDAVNEFREQQADIIARFLLRAEYDASHKALVEKTDESTSRMNAQLAALELRLSKRLDVDDGKSAGVRSVTGTGYEMSAYNLDKNIATGVTSRAWLSIFISVAVAVISLISLIIVVILKK